MSHFTNDLSDNSVSTALDQLVMDMTKEYGNFSKKEVYENLIRLSPYHLPMHVSQNRPITDLLICCEEQYNFKYHSRKMIAKLREVYASDPLYAFFREFPSKMYTEDQI